MSAARAGRQRYRRLRARVALTLVAVLRLLLLPLGWRGAQMVGAALGSLAWLLLGRDRRLTLEHLAIAFPELSPHEHARIGQRSFAHFGTMLFECLRMLGGDCAQIGRRTRWEGWEELERVRAAGRQILLFTGHCGNWELMAAGVSCRGLPLAVVAREAHEPELDQFVVGLRARYGTRTILRGSSAAARELLRALRGGTALGMLIDQDTKVEGVFVPFFGRGAFTPVGAAQIALHQDLAVIPVFVERLDDGSHLVRLLPALDLPADATAATALMTTVIETQVRRRPEQWVWMHRRWRRRPPDEAAVTVRA